MTADERNAVLDEAIKAAKSEEELAGHIPDHMRIDCKTAPETYLRAVCRTTKRGIINKIRALKRSPAPEKAAEGVDLERAKELCSHIPNTFAGNGNSLMELVFMAPALVAEVERLRKENGFYGMEVEADKSQIRRQIIELEQLQSSNARMRKALEIAVQAARDKAPFESTKLGWNLDHHLELTFTIRELRQMAEALKES